MLGNFVNNSNESNTKNVTAQCKVVVYSWVENLSNPDLPDGELSKSTRLEISSQVINASFTKNMGNAAGSFSITLANSPNYGSNDWKDIIKRGSWCVIYMSNDGGLELSSEVKSIKPKQSEAKYIRCIGYIERASVTGSTLGSRGIDYNFVISGRDFGVIYEDTEIWHNIFKYDKIMLDSIAQTKLNITGNVRIHEAIKVVHDLIFYPKNLPGAKVGDNNSLVSIGLQWLLPKEMMIDLGYSLSSLASGTFWGSIPDSVNVSETGAGIAIEKPGDYLSGNAWSQLKRLSIPAYHELFCEIGSNNKPQLIFRPIPWAIDNSKYPINAKNIKQYKDLEFITVPAVDLYAFDLAEDDHNRYNSFLATVSTSLINLEDNIALLDGRDFPRNNSASIRRHGFRPMHVSVDSIVKNEELGNGSADALQLNEFNEILYDYWNNMIFAENGSISKLGSNDVRVGKCLKFSKDVPYLNGKRYYIEGYSDTFVVEDNMATSWTQEVNLTRGFEEDDLKSKQGFSRRNFKFTASGEFTGKN